MNFPFLKQFTILLLVLFIYVPCSAQSTNHLEVLGTSLFEVGGDRLTISNIGSSGIDGMRIESSDILELRALDPTFLDLTTIQLIPTATPDVFFDVWVDIGDEGRVQYLDLTTPSSRGTALRFNEQQSISGQGPSGGLGTIRISPNASLGKDHLTVSNIGSSGDDGVGLDFGDHPRIIGQDSNPGGSGGQLQLFPSTAVDHDHLVVSNIGASGDDGVRVETEIISMSLSSSPPSLILDNGIGNLTFGNTGSALTEGASLINTDPASGRLAHINLNAPQLRVCMNTGRGEYLVLSNIGASGDDGVRMSSTGMMSGTGLTSALDLNTQMGTLGLEANGLRIDLSNASAGGAEVLRMDAGSCGRIETWKPSTGSPAVWLIPDKNNSSDLFGVWRHNHPSLGQGLAWGDQDLWLGNFNNGATLNMATTTHELLRLSEGSSRVDMLVNGNVRLAGLTNALEITPDLGNNGRRLTVSNIGSSGQDGVSFDTEILSMDLVSTTPAFVFSRLSETHPQLTADFSPIGALSLRCDPPPGGTTAPHIFTYDAIGNRITCSGPPTTSYEFDDLQTEYVYDGLNRIVRTIYRDNDPASPSSFMVDADLALNRLQVGTNLDVTGILSKGGGAFKIDHPLDPYNKYLYHSFVESPDMMNIYNGNVITDKEGYAIVKLPGYFSALNRDFRYQLTVVGQFAQAIIKEKIKNGKFVIQTDKPSVEVSWQVTGIRQDRFANDHRIIPEVEKGEGERGRLLSEFSVSPNRPN